MASVAGGGGGSGLGPRGSIMLRHSLSLLLSGQQQAVNRIKEGTPTIVPASDRSVITQVRAPPMPMGLLPSLP